LLITNQTRTLSIHLFNFDSSKLALTAKLLNVQRKTKNLQMMVVIL